MKVDRFEESDNTGKFAFFSANNQIRKVFGIVSEECSHLYRLFVDLLREGNNNELCNLVNRFQRGRLLDKTKIDGLKLLAVEGKRYINSRGVLGIVLCARDSESRAYSLLALRGLLSC